MKKRVISIVAIVLVVAMMSVLLIACTPEDVKSATEKMENKEYGVVGLEIPGFIKSAMALANIKIEGGIVATSKKENETGYTMTAVLFSDNDAAKNSMKFVEDNFYKNYKDELDKKIKDTKDEDAKKALEEVKKSTTIKQSGNWIIFGYSKAVSAFTGL